MTDRRDVMERLKKKIERLDDPYVDVAEMEMQRLCEDALKVIKESPDVVRCKECYFKECEGRNGAVVCDLDGDQHEGDWYCPRGERINQKTDN